MSDARKCSSCGAELPTTAPGGHCLACLLQLALATGDSPPPADTPRFQSGDRIGRYQLLEELGEGGCGIVFLAQQEEPVRRQVALKVIKPGMDTRQVIARFEAERQALALLEHPNIARVLDAGATDSGRPYFVMELVRGVKITDYCDQQKLSTRQRLELFVEVCRAVEHAHQKGIIHRDLKPSNILVTEDDHGATPKIIDFGIAKSTEQRLTDKTLFTALQQFMGTPAYMSPEQAGMGNGEIDARSDIYSLGVLLYEMLTGLAPFDSVTLQRRAVDEVLRFIRENEPPRPSAKVTSLTPPQLTSVASCRQIEPARLPRLLQGDLDWIVMKCLEKDCARRYETASGLGEDLQRHLNHQPVTARPPSGAYRIQKWVRRHQLRVAAGAMVLLALTIGLGIAARSRSRENEALIVAAANRKIALTEAAKTREATRLLDDLLRGVGPSTALGRDTTMLREILEKTAERLDHDLKDQPEVETHLRATLAETYRQLGRYEQMEAMAQQSLRINRTRPDMVSRAIAEALEQLGEAEMHLGRLDAAEQSARDALDMWKKISGKDSPDVSEALNNLAIILRDEGRAADAEPLFRESLAMSQRLSKNEDPDVAAKLSNLSTVLWAQGKLAEAETTGREALALRQKIYGREYPDVATSLNNLAIVLLSEKKFAEAETLVREALAMDRKFLGNEHPEVAISLGNLGNVLAAQGKFAEAETADREALAIDRKLLGNEHPDVATRLDNLSKDLTAQGKQAEAEKLSNEAIVIRKR